MEPAKTFTDNHDIGFMMYCSYGNANRFAPKDEYDKVYDFPVIIDNMMNLELLFHASKVTGDESFRKVAISHAEQVMHHQVRKDYSCFHIIYYDKKTGKPIKGETSQGYSDNSAW